MRASSSRPPLSSRMLIDSNSIPRTDRYSFTRRQLVQCGCQKTLMGAVMANSFLSHCDTARLTKIVEEKYMRRNAIEQLGPV